MTNNFTVAFLPAYRMSTSYILRLYIPPNLKVKIGPTNRYAYCRTDLCINYSIPYGSAFSLLDYAGRINADNTEMVSVCQIANPLNAMDAQTWVVGDGDLPLVEHRAAQDGVLAAQHGAVQVDLGDDLLGAG